VLVWSWRFSVLGNPVLAFTYWRLLSFALIVTVVREVGCYMVRLSLMNDGWQYLYRQRTTELDGPLATNPDSHTTQASLQRLRSTR